MNKYWIFGILIISIILGLFLYPNNIFLSPDGANMGCATQDQDPPKGKLLFRLFTEPRPIYNNCAVDSMAQINAELFNIDEGSLRSELIECMHDKGIDTIRNGVDKNTQVQPLIDCKKKAMKERGVDEEIGGGINGPGAPPTVPPGTSPFKNNCPEIGSKIILAGGGHAMVCIVDSCNPKTGEAHLTCRESNFKLPIEEACRGHNVNIDKDGIIHDHPWSTDNKPSWFWERVIEVPRR